VRGLAVLAGLLAVLAVAACATTSRPMPGDLRPMPAAPGAGLSGIRVIVLPVSALRGGDALGWAASVTDPESYLTDLNAQIARALPARASRTVWLLPSDLQKVANRNPGYAPDANRLDPSQFAPDRWRPGAKLQDPLASDLRMLTAFVDARVALVPAELRFFPRADGSVVKGAAPTRDANGRAVLRVALVDTRSMAVFWVGDVAGTPSAALSPAVNVDLANQLASALSTQ
jgi:hypothetical protein